MKTPVAAAAFGFAFLVCGAAYAAETVATAAATSPTPTPTATVKPDKAAMQARAQECSKEAEVQGLMHKERKKFREKCMKGLK